MISKQTFYFLIALVLPAPVHAQSAYHPHESIYASVKDYIAKHIYSSDYEAVLMPLDRQLKLAPCPEPLEVFAADDTIRTGRNSLGVRCKAADKWSIYISAVIKTYQPVLVLTQAVQRGDTITRQQLSLERRDVSGLRGDFVSEFEKIDNKQVLRPMVAGTILSIKNIADPKVIKRGDKIIISSSKPGFAIRMNGMAMMDGAKGQLIRIKNQSSGRIISATVMEAGLVSVNN